MDFIFDDENETVVRLVGNQIVGGLKLNVVEIALELSHQVSPPLDSARPTRKLVEHLVDDVVRDDVEEMIALNGWPSAPRTKLK